MKNEFDKFVNTRCKITKMSTKNPGFFGDGFFDYGDMSLQGDGDLMWVQLVSPSTWMKTSPIVAIIDKTDKSITFETENSTYKLEMTSH